MQAGGDGEAGSNQKGRHPGSKAVVPDGLEKVKHHQHRGTAAIRWLEDIEEMAVDFLHGMRIGGGKRCAQLPRDACFHSGGNTLGIRQMAVRDQRTGTLWYAAADEPYEDRTYRADQDDPAPAFKTERVTRYQRPGQQGHHGNDAELYDLVHRESTAAQVFGYEFGDVGIDGHQLNADADACDHAPGDYA